MPSESTTGTFVVGRLEQQVLTEITELTESEIATATAALRAVWANDVADEIQVRSENPDRQGEEDLTKGQYQIGSQAQRLLDACRALEGTHAMDTITALREHGASRLADALYVLLSHAEKIPE
jgi:hypothetical protein